MRRLPVEILFYTFVLISSYNNLFFIQSIHLHVAPMQGYTSKYLRLFFRLLNSKAILWTEMEKVDDLLSFSQGDDHDVVYNNGFTKRLGHFNIENPVVLQLGGNNVAKMKQTIKTINKYHETNSDSLSFYYNEINLNCGCPSIETGGADYGASLMLQPMLTKDIIKTIHEEVNKQSHHKENSNQSFIPEVSIKCRIGAYNTLDDYQNYGNNYNTLSQYISDITNGHNSNGINHVVVHARSAILSGLSSSKNRIIPSLHYEYVHRLAMDFPHIRITLNGGIQNIADIQRHVIHDVSNIDSSKISKLDGVMIGRWFLKRPLDLWKIRYMSNDNDSIKSSTSSNKTFYVPFPSNKSLLSYSITDLSKDRIKSLKVNSIEDAIIQYTHFIEQFLQDTSNNNNNKKNMNVFEMLLPFILSLEQMKEDIDTNDISDTSIFSTYTEMTVQSDDTMSYEQIYDIFKVIAESSQLLLSYTQNDSSKYISAIQEVLINLYDTDTRLCIKKLLNILLLVCGKKVGNKIMKNRSEMVNMNNGNI